jgi:XTP/dITP diphosphohydrolase
MKLEFMLASGNAHKAQEFSELFDPNLLSVVPAPEKVEVVEDGESYAENALKKAQGYFEKYKVPVMSDDSGLNVEALPDELGIHSARFGGPDLSDQGRAQLLLEKLEGLPEAKRRAYFTCYLCFYLSKNEVYFFEGRLKGRIADQLTGGGGFGYDPVFVPEGLERKLESKSLAEVPEWKGVHSHRASAVSQATRFFKERNGQRS